ncbi:hypothetical protein RV11_GL001306 [Enterococcus phoeniculicola]|uniref:Glycerol dehydrogenase n=1 Tax=Enterococcus phoeniculicola ATCC BAA-412 TaxID=1158610 RepID=R3TYH0_9ENTE|nr:glycerol dehydrogenase [Enterococcus phoeniculicola]EOL46654.1 hypothetical protein UC3_00774 [Enterococcus phoeniculicola ATCC BAA-412]EOT77185.1 hypothetical protein I589_02147 [Enterococcus phoeniculicola ATCC BAA-412]OJG73526.1 hypothetical protein RV11_GL001306 [Enterococcus phoeniculicola]
MKIFTSPGKYVQGPKILKTNLAMITAYGKQAIIVTDSFVWEMIGKTFNENLQKEAIATTIILLDKQSPNKDENPIVCREEAIDFVIALGGGKAIDFGKAVANKQKVPVIVVPTAASTDAPTSAISVTYDDKGFFQSYHYYDKNPDLVFVDTDVLVNAPVRMLKSGIADGLATFIEAEAVAKSHGKTLAGGTQTIAAHALAKTCEETLFFYGKQAIAANEAQAVTPAFEAVVEATTLLSGLGFESGGLAAAHALQNSFSSIEGEIQKKTHGEKVAFSTLVQLMLQGDSEERMERFITFYQSIGLPTTLNELGLGLSDKELLSLCEKTVDSEDTMKQMPMKITGNDLFWAIRATDSYVKMKVSAHK